MSYRLPALLMALALPGLSPAAESPPSSPPSPASEEQRLDSEFQNLQHSGKLDEAIPVAEKQLAADRKLLAARSAEPADKHDWTTVQVRLQNMLSWLLAQQVRREDYAAAVRCQREIAELAEQAFGKDDNRALEARREVAYRELLQRLKPEDARSLVKVDQSSVRVDRLLKLGKFPEAQAILEENLHIRRRLLGEHDTRTGNSFFRLAVCRHRQRDFTQAENLYRRAIAIEADTSSPRETASLSSYLFNLGLLLAAGDKFDDAAASCRRAAAIYQRLSTTNAAYRATAESTIATLVGILQRQAGKAMREEKWDSAGKALRELVELQANRFGPKHWQTTNARLAVTHLARLQSLLPDERRDLLAADADFRRANDHRLPPKPEVCLKLTEQCRAVYERLLGPEAPEMATILTQIALIHSGQGAYSRAEPLFRQALKIRSKVFGEDHPQYAASLSNLATLYQAQGDFAKAEPLFLQALHIRKRILGEGDPDYAASLNGLANLHYSQGDYARAEKLLRQALEIL